MKARELEKLVVAEGATASKVATIATKLRETGRLSKSGRGPYAPTINARQAATMLVAVAGSSRANVAGARIEKLEALTLNGEEDEATLIGRLTEILEDARLSSAIEEVRVARTIGRAVILYRMGQIEEFLGGTRYDLNRRFRSVGELPGGLLETVAQLLQVTTKRRTPKRRGNPDW